MNFLEFNKKFTSEGEVISHFIKVRYGDYVCCHHCGSVRIHHRGDQPKLFKCSDCNNSFSIFKGTIFENSSTALVKWMYAIHLFLNGKKGVSGLQLKREVGVTYKTAWRMLRQIRLAMGNQEVRQEFEDIVEMDETYIGGKPRKNNFGNKDADKLIPNKRGRGTDKTPVVGVIERGTKKIHAVVAVPNKAGKKLSGKQLLEILKSVTKEKTVVMTDYFSSYNILKYPQYTRLRIDHKKQFADGFIHTNNIESFWATLKRGIYGIYHHVSPKYLQQYVNEFCFRHNNKDNPDMFDALLRKTIITP